MMRRSAGFIGSRMRGRLCAGRPPPPAGPGCAAAPRGSHGSCRSPPAPAWGPRPRGCGSSAAAGARSPQELAVVRKHQSMSSPARSTSSRSSPWKTRGLRSSPAMRTSSSAAFAAASADRTGRLGIALGDPARLLRQGHQILARDGCSPLPCGRPRRRGRRDRRDIHDRAAAGARRSAPDAPALPVSRGRPFAPGPTHRRRGSRGCGDGSGGEPEAAAGWRSVRPERPPEAGGPRGSGTRAGGGGEPPGGRREPHRRLQARVVGIDLDHHLAAGLEEAVPLLEAAVGDVARVRD